MRAKENSFILPPPLTGSPLKFANVRHIAKCLREKDQNFFLLKNCYYVQRFFYTILFPTEVSYRYKMFQELFWFNKEFSLVEKVLETLILETELRLGLG